MPPITSPPAVADALLEALLCSLERLAWYWVLCKTGEPTRTWRALQVSGSGTAAEAQASMPLC